MQVIPIDIPELGNRSYLVHDGVTAIVIDPSRRTKQVLDTAKDTHVTVRAVFETHIHNDYITGGLVLASELKVPYYVSAHDQVAFDHDPIEPEQTVAFGTLRVTAIAAPGHTYHHISYLVTTDTDETPALFSGGSLLYGAVGRTDLVSAKDTFPLAKAQYQTAQFFRNRFDPRTNLYPTHGFGSFCAAADTEHIAISTLQQQITTNLVYNAKDEANYIAAMLAGLDDYPAYYAYMAPANLQGPISPNLDPPSKLTRAAVLSALHSGVAVVDMRSRTAYAAKHLSGTYNVELDDSLATYVGWLIAWDTPLILVAASKELVNTAQEQLSLIGREVTGGQIAPNALLAKDTVSYPTRTFADLAKTLPYDHLAIIDVRRKSEWQKRHIPEATHIQLHELTSRLQEIDANKTLWIYCSTGFRASIAASIADSQGRQVVLIDDNFSNAMSAGLIPIEEKPFVLDVRSGKAQLVDIRDTAAWQTEHAVDALHVPLGQLLEGDTGMLDSERQIYVYCDTGDRSGMAENCLCGLGFDAVNIGGLADWVQGGGATKKNEAQTRMSELH